MSTFLCSLRTVPAAASVCVGWVVAQCRCLGGGQSACDLLVVGALDAVVGDGPIPVGHGLFLNRQIQRGGVARILLELLALSPANHRPDLEPEVPGIVDGLPIVVSVIHPSESTEVH